jgi:hypothetical protein
VRVLGVLRHVVRDERAEGNDFEPLLARVVENALHQAAAEAAALAGRVDLGVCHSEAPVAPVVRGQADEAAVAAQLVPGGVRDVESLGLVR